MPRKRPASRAEALYINTEEWRSRAETAFTARGRGSKRRCALEKGFDPGLLTKILKGKQLTSVEIGPISDWLGIAPPPRPEGEKVARIVEIANELDELGQEMLLGLAEVTRRSRSANSNR